jgi:hypothetical protein
MLIIVADQGGLAGAAIRHALESKLQDKTVRVVSAFKWKDVVYYLEKYRPATVLAAQPIKDFPSSSIFASEVKKVCPDAGFFVYNCMLPEQSPDIDGYLPACPRGSIDSVIVPFFRSVIRNRSTRPGQLQLF